MLGDGRFRKVAARVVVDDKNVEGTYASDSVATAAQNAIAALVLFLVLIMVVLIRLDVALGLGSSSLNLVRHRSTVRKAQTVDGKTFCIAAAAAPRAAALADDDMTRHTGRYY